MTATKHVPLPTWRRLLAAAIALPARYSMALARQPGDRPASKHLVMFVAANPQGTAILRLAEECAEVQRELALTPYRDDFRFEARWAVSIDDLMRYLTELDPVVIHVAGHAGLPGIVLQNADGRPQLVPARALTMIIAAAAPHARVVLLNACETMALAEALRTRVECVVAMDGAIGDDAARAFAVRFYGALGNRRSIGNAVAHGIAALAARQLADEVLPRCLYRAGVDPQRMVL